MKINTRKSVIFTALAVMVLATALVIGCTSPVDGLLGVYEPTAPGTGRAKLSINNSRNASRTILPELPNTIQYWVTFYSGATAVHAESITLTSGNGTMSNIPAGSYDKIEAIVCTDATNITTATDTSFAKGSITGTFTITPGGSLNLTVTNPITTALYSPATSGGTGTFSYDFDLSNITAALLPLKKAEFQIVARAGTASLTGPLAATKSFLTTNASTVTSIPAGYYNVIFTLQDKLNNYAYFYQILHVYKNMISTYEYDGFSDYLFPVPPPPPSNGSGTLNITGPSAPSDASCALVAGGTDSAKINVDDTNSKVFVVTLTKPITAGTLTLTANPSTIKIKEINTMIGSTVTPITSGGGLTFTAPNSSSNTITLNIDTTSPAPFASLSGSYIIIIEGDDDYSFPMIYVIVAP